MMNMNQIIMIVIVLAIGFWLGRTFPNAVPIPG